MTVEHHGPGQLFDQPGLESIPQSGDPCRIRLQLLGAQPARLSEAYDTRHVQRTGAQATLLPPSLHLRRQLQRRSAPANEQRTLPLRTVYLVRRDRHQVHGK